MEQLALLAEEAPAAIPNALASRRTDPVWDACVEVVGLAGAKLSAATASRIGKVVNKTIRAVDGDEMTDDELAAEVRRRAAIYHGRWPRASLTPEALAKHWEVLGCDDTAVRTGAASNESIGDFTHVKPGRIEL